MEAHAKGEGQFVDVRGPDQDLFVQGFVSVPHYNVKEQMSKFSREAPIYLIDTAGFYSARVAAELESQGFSRVNVISGGLLMWQFHGGAPRFRDPQKQARADWLLAQQQQPPNEQVAREAAVEFGFDPNTAIPELLTLNSAGEVVEAKH
eukprot:TRINITY_DN964_c1_g1_i2.p2 TRINITY_DN964_c1_g1~~TRINITY_DN964_c1_g1_i2.p2  ORF type:complete len:149 (-),score=47.96 TRINITY_DN964_c1_g1_i2:126-572(-)